MKPVAPPAHLFQSKPTMSGTAKQTIKAKPCVNITVRNCHAEPGSSMVAAGKAASRAFLITVGNSIIITATITGSTSP